MEQIISKITTSEVKIDIPKHNIDFYKDNYVSFIDEYTPHIRATETRYNPYFFYYKGDTIIGQSLELYGEYTEFEINLLNQFIQPHFVVYDIGANIGYHTLGFAQRAKHVYAFEPNTKNYYLLERNTFHKNNITILDYLVSNDIGVSQIEDFALGEHGNYGECKVVDDGQLCDMTYIDHLVRTKEIETPQLVKIDVEGHEYEVILGMQQTIENNLPIIFYENMHGNNLGKIVDFLHSYKYKLYWFPCMNYNPQNYKNNKTNIFGYGGVMNALAMPWFISLKTNLPEILDSKDTFEEAVKRTQK